MPDSDCACGRVKARFSAVQQEPYSVITAVTAGWAHQGTRYSMAEAETKRQIKIKTGVIKRCAPVRRRPLAARQRWVDGAGNAVLLRACVQQYAPGDQDVRR